MFGTEGNGEENRNGLSAVCSGLFCLLPLQLKELVFIWLLGHVVGHRKKTNRKFLLIGHSLIDITKSELNGGVAYGFAVFFSHSGKKRTAPMTVYLFKVSYDSL